LTVEPLLTKTIVFIGIWGYDAFALHLDAVAWQRYNFPKAVIEKDGSLDHRV
jgi:hypothetical protein